MSCSPFYVTLAMATLVLTTACQPDARDRQANGGESVSQQTVAPRPASASETGPAPPRASGDEAVDTAIPSPSRRACYLSVDGEAHLEDECLVYPFGDGGFTLNAWSDGRPAQSHFAVVVMNPDGTGDATWNADPDDTRAGDRLGTVRFVEGCWRNERARICAAGLR